MKDILLILGCQGQKAEGITLCQPCSNVILKLNDQIHQYQKLSNYLDQVKLYDYPIVNISGIRHVLFNLQRNFSQVNRPIWSDKKFEILQQYLISHKHCTPFLQLDME